MADKAIGSLVEATVINDADRFVLEQSGQAKQISGATMISELAEALDGHGGIQSIDLVSGEGNVKTYRITFTDGTSYDYEVRDGESGNYAVVARNLAPYSDASGATQSIPFLSQGTGRGNGSATVSAGNYCQLKKLGNTVCVNQLVKNGTFSTGNLANWAAVGTSTRTVSGGVLTIQTSAVSAVYQSVPLVNGHKYILCATLSATSGANVAFGVYKNASGWYSSNITADGAKHIVFRTIDASTIADTDYFDVRVRHNDTNSVTITIEKVWLVDLSIWYGSTDRIPSDLLAHPEYWGRYYAGSLAYAAGYLDSADGTVLKSIGRNVWDEAWELGGISSITGENDNSVTSQIRSVNYIPIIPSTDYYFKNPSTLGLRYYDTDKNYIGYTTVTNASKTTPSNAFFLRFIVVSTTTYANDITISLYYPGESGYDQYYPFSVLAEVDTGSEVLRSAGSAADEKTPDGTITRRIKSVDLSSLTWSLRLTGTTHKLWSATLPSVYKAKYSTDAKNNWRSAPFFYIHNTSYTTVATAGVDYCDVGVYDYVTSGTSNVVYCITGVSDSPTGYLFYELATPTTEQGTAFAENIPCDPVGSMSWENTNGIPQGAEILYPFDYAGTLDSMLKALPSANGTYTFKATVANGKITYSWVAD